jgi:hypothetical protein
MLCHSMLCIGLNSLYNLLLLNDLLVAYVSPLRVKIYCQLPSVSAKGWSKWAAGRHSLADVLSSRLACKRLSLLQLFFRGDNNICCNEVRLNGNRLDLGFRGPRPAQCSEGMTGHTIGQVRFWAGGDRVRQAAFAFLRDAKCRRVDIEIL